MITDESPLTPTRPASGLRWHVADDYETMSFAASAWLAVELQQKPDALVCLASGSTPRRMYELLAARRQAEPVLFARVRWMKLDEWGGVPLDDPATCECDLRGALLDPLGVPPDRYLGWQSDPVDPEAECRRIADWLRTNGPIDIQVLGLGRNGHLGFNEPADVLQTGPHVATLSATSLTHPMLGGSIGRVRYGLTIGVSDILQARRILLVANGAHKARQLLRLATEPPSPQFPASALHGHSDVSVFCDRAAAELLPQNVAG